ncbi:hypothetical protein GQ457_18G012840 [Hibiscus cannabinus]
MASTSSNNIYESQLITKSPYFNGDNYSYCKNRMKLFIKSQDYIHWDVVEDGPTIPLKKEGDWLVLKSKLEMTDEDQRTNDVKETKIGLLNLSYENYKMEPNESITKMFDWFSVILNGIKGFAEIIPKYKLVQKLIMKKGREDEKIREEKMVVKKVVKKKIGIASKASQEESDYSEEEDEEMALLAKRDFKNKNKENKKDQLICYECKKPGLIRTDCPQLKKKSFRKKNKKLNAHVATWSDEEL